MIPNDIPDKYSSSSKEMIEQFAQRYPFELDQFQQEAMRHLAEGDSVLVAAPTGTGKTMVAEYAIWQALQNGQRVIYTTPLKALSNQKYQDLCKLYGSDRVGLMTGDIVEHRHAPIVIMTTEVYRNMLLEEDRYQHEHPETERHSPLDDVAFLVFDELHYLSDPQRGPVWEEAIICSPPHIRIVGLSATVSNADELIDWISRVHRPIALVTHEQRAVPLEHYYLLDGKLRLVQDTQGKRVEQFPKIGGEAKQQLQQRRFSSAPRRRASDERAVSFERERERGQEQGRERGGYTRGGDNRRGQWQERERGQGYARGGDNRRGQWQERQQADVSAQQSGGRRNYRPDDRRPDREQERGTALKSAHKAPTPAEILQTLQDADMLPCLYFLPGRKLGEEAALQAAEHSFTTPEEQQQIMAHLMQWQETLPEEDRQLQQVQSLLRLLPRGIGFHHAGLLPGLKVLVEHLFVQGLLHAVFATDTLALGVNMPARTVVVGSLSKFDGQQMRLLTPNEYRQLTGRAGRRGLDTQGAAIIPYSPWEPFEEAFAHLVGPQLPVTSSFTIRYNSVLNLWRSENEEYLQQLCASSLHEYHQALQRLQRKHQYTKKGGKAAGRNQSKQAMLQQLDYPSLSRQGDAELRGVIDILHALDYIQEDEELSIKGHLLRQIYHPAGVLMVELMTGGLLDNCTPHELAEIFSWLAFERDRRLPNQYKLSARLNQVRQELVDVEELVHELEGEVGLSLSPSTNPDFHSLILAWAKGRSLSDIVQHVEMAEGDLLMVLNHTIDLLQQLQAAVGQVLDTPRLWDPEQALDYTHKRKRRKAEKYLKAFQNTLTVLRPKLARAAAALTHGLVLQTRTLPSMMLPTEAVVEEEEEEAIELVEELEPIQTVLGLSGI